MVPARHAPSHEAHRRPNTGALFRTFEATDFPTDFSPDGMVSDHGQAHEPLNQPPPQRHIFAPAPAIRREPVDDGPTPTSRAASSRNFAIHARRPTRRKERGPIHFSALRTKPYPANPEVGIPGISGGFVSFAPFSRGRTMRTGRVGC